MQTNPSDINVDVSYQNILIIWMAIFMSVLLYLVLFWMVPVPPNEQKSSLAVVLGAVSVLPVAVSFLVKNTMLARAAATQNLGLAQQAYIAGFALSEVAALLGVLIHFVTGSPYRFVAIGIGAAGMLLHFPRKKYLFAATIKPL